MLLVYCFERENWKYKYKWSDKCKILESNGRQSLDCATSISIRGNRLIFLPKNAQGILKTQKHSNGQQQQQQKQQQHNRE